VGFPGESRSQFEDTLRLVEKVQYDAAYTFIFSPRKGTLAAEYPDPVSIEEKTKWIEELISLQQTFTTKALESQTGTTQSVLVESVSARSNDTVGGKTPRGLMVNFPGGKELVGRIVNVKITEHGKNTLKGVREN
jgi:tRNA-2-methylthio-N6-dimethylallyladenosine synthase